eukprot:1151788-Pelagomonas_calceolata.AAC.1
MAEILYLTNCWAFSLHLFCNDILLVEGQLRMDNPIHAECKLYFSYTNLKLALFECGVSVLSVLPIWDSDLSEIVAKRILKQQVAKLQKEKSESVRMVATQCGPRRLAATL